MVPLVLISAAAFAQGDNRAVPRGGSSGSSGGGSSGDSGAGSRHTGGSSGGNQGASSNPGNRGGSSTSGRESEYGSSAQGAAGRRPRPGTGTGTRDRHGNEYDQYRGYGYSYPYGYGYGYGNPYSYYYSPYVYGGYPGRYGLYGYGYGYGANGYLYGDYGDYSPPYPRSYGHRSGNIAELRALVDPPRTRVYVDGAYAGVADDFDGVFQRLNISPGRHDITLRLEGYSSHTFSIYARPDQTLKLRWDMVRGSGETRDSTGDEYGREPDRDSDRDRDPGRESESARDRDAARLPADRSARGEMLLDVEPADASVYVDGEFHGKASQVTRLELPAGRHRLEVVRPGYKTEEAEVDIDGQARRVTVKLERR
jgi:hypothetical protein